MNLVSSNSKKVFLCSDTKIDEKGKVDIILSPEFYWVRVFDIPVKSSTQARHVLPTLFEDILENVNELSYQVIKLEEDKYLCFAYENKKIYQSIKNSGVSLSSVNSVYFAQNECTSMPQFIAEEKSFLYTQDGILVKVPNGLLSDAVNIDTVIDQIELSSNKVDIKLYNNVLSSKQIYSLVVILLILASINFFKFYEYKNENKKLEEKTELLRANSKLPSSMIQTNSILKKYKAISNLERKKREALSYILENKAMKLKKIKLEKSVLTMNFTNTDKRKADNYISRKYKIISSQVTSLSLDIKVKL